MPDLDTYFKGPSNYRVTTKNGLGVPLEDYKLIMEEIYDGSNGAKVLELEGDLIKVLCGSAGAIETKEGQYSTRVTLSSSVEEEDFEKLKEIAKAGIFHMRKID